MALINPHFNGNAEETFNFLANQYLAESSQKIMFPKTWQPRISGNDKMKHIKLCTLFYLLAKIF
jgi:hypothetical protein